MIGQIVNAMSMELVKLFDGRQETVIFDTQLNKDNVPLSTKSLIMLTLNDAPDSSQMPGGGRKLELDWNIKVWMYEPNPELSYDKGYSANLINIVDEIDQHFANQQWLSDEFKSIVNDYGFKMTMEGITQAEPLEDFHGMGMGFILSYWSVGIDLSTMFTKYSDKALQTVEQVQPNNKFDY